MLLVKIYAIFRNLFKCRRRKKIMLEDTQDYISIIQKHKRQRAMKSKL